MQKKEMISTVKWNEKNKIYLSKLGFTDKRDGKVKKNMNMSGFINHCVTIVLEANKSPHSPIANFDSLHAAWIQYNVAKRNREIAKLKQEVVDLTNTKHLEKKYNKSLEMFK